MVSGSAGSRPNASAGKQSVIRLIKSRCTGLSSVKPSMVAKNTPKTSLMLLARRNCMVFLILSYILLPSSTAETMVAKLSSESTISATFLVTSVPVIPMPTPMSADLMLGASFTPSPVMAVMAPLRLHAETMRTLCSGCTRAYTPHLSISLSSSSSLSLFSSLPSMACEASSIMPSSLAIATAVSLWSPVIITGRMPAALHSSTAALTSGRTGSIMPTRPMKQSSCSRFEGSVFSGILCHSLSAAANTRRAFAAMA